MENDDASVWLTCFLLCPHDCSTFDYVAGIYGLKKGQFVYACEGHNIVEEAELIKRPYHQAECEDSRCYSISHFGGYGEVSAEKERIDCSGHCCEEVDVGSSDDSLSGYEGLPLFEIFEIHVQAVLSEALYDLRQMKL